MTNLEKFLEQYLQLESVLKQNPELPDTVLSYESTLDQDTEEKMKLCRIIRNYCRHHDDYKKFVEVSDGMISFIDSQIRIIQAELLRVKDITKRIKTVSVKDNLKTALDLLSASSMRLLPVEDGDGNILCLLNADAVLEMVRIGTMKMPISKIINEKSVQKNLVKYVSADTDDLVEKYDAGDILLVFSKGKYRGIAVL